MNRHIVHYSSDRKNFGTEESCPGILGSNTVSGQYNRDRRRFFVTSSGGDCEVDVLVIWCDVDAFILRPMNTRKCSTLSFSDFIFPINAPAMDVTRISWVTFG
mmetsp:Transcript_2904/g.5486  ORF Transcript_2904/g.5486 Transcript_2904/m.5486 type:complete len:103 (+) Transcript_2904:248-556(+)